MDKSEAELASTQASMTTYQGRRPTGITKYGGGETHELPNPVTKGGGQPIRQASGGTSLRMRNTSTAGSSLRSILCEHGRQRCRGKEAP